MSEVGYCTVEDVRRLLQEADLTGALGEDDNRAVVDAIVAQSEWLQETTNRHWFEPGGVADDSHDLIPTGPLTHENDEQDLETSAVIFADDPITPSTNGPGSYTAVDLFRRDVEQLTELLVLNAEGGFDNWVDDAEFDGGRGAEYYLQVDDADGWATLYLDTSAIDDEGDPDDPDDDGITDYRKAVVATYEYGIEGLTGTVRRGTAALAVLILLADDEAALGIPDNGNLVPADSKISVIEREAERLLEIHEDTR